MVSLVLRQRWAVIPWNESESFLWAPPTVVISRPTMAGCCCSARDVSIGLRISVVSSPLRKEPGPL
jgi:hypothetical protein